MAGSSRHLLEERKLDEALFAKGCEFLPAGGTQLLGGAIADGTLIAAPPSTKMQEKSRNPKMHQGKKIRVALRHYTAHWDGQSDRLVL